MRRAVFAALLLSTACSHRERQQELLDKVQQQRNEYNAPAPPGSPIAVGTNEIAGSVTIEYVRIEHPAGRDPQLILVVHNDSAHAIRDIEGLVAITTDEGKHHVGFRIPVTVEANSTREYAMDYSPDWEGSKEPNEPPQFSVTEVKWTS